MRGPKHLERELNLMSSTKRKETETHKQVSQKIDSDLTEKRNALKRVKNNLKIEKANKKLKYRAVK